jgi:ASPIC/UnbV protein/VCBS repeat protein
MYAHDHRTDRIAATLCAGAFILVGSTIAHAQFVTPLRFEDQAVERGVDFQMAFNMPQVGAGLMLADLDNDGDIDLVVAGGVDGAWGIYENDGNGYFTDRGAGSNIEPMQMAAGLAAGDYDNDGDLDIHVPGMFVPSRLYRNEGDFRFTEVGRQAGIAITAPSMGSSWGDYDKDGHLDLYATVKTFTDGVEIENKLYHNNGDGTFTDVAKELRVEAPGDPSLLSTFFDYDRDGDDDIYVGTDKGSRTGRMLHNKLYENMGDGTFRNATYAAGAEAWIFCMGIALGDINFDGYFDMYLTNIPQGNILYVYDGEGRYDEVTEQAGVGSYITGWGTVFADFDNDTYLDLYVCNMQGPNRLYRGSPNWPMNDEAPIAGVDTANDVFCVAVGDVDGDDDLDMLVGNREGGVLLYINKSPSLSENNWVRFNVVGEDTNRHAIGTCVDVLAGGKSQARQVRAGVNYKSHDEFTLHYGLADAQIVKRIDITFASGERRKLVNAPVNQTWSLYPDSKLGDPNFDGVIELDEIFAAMGAMTSPGETLTPRHEIFDMDGDFDIDLDDIAEMRRRMYDQNQ